jgi:hypothetical protein
MNLPFFAPSELDDETDTSRKDIEYLGFHDIDIEVWLN